MSVFFIWCVGSFLLLVPILWDVLLGLPFYMTGWPERLMPIILMPFSLVFFHLNRKSGKTWQQWVIGTVGLLATMYSIFHAWLLWQMFRAFQDYYRV